MIYVSPLSARIANRLGLLQTFRIGYTLKILESVFKIPIIENKEGFNYHFGMSEPFLLNILKQLYKVKNFTFLDAGVNFGQTLLKIKAVNPDAAYIGFEPSGLCAYYTSHLIKVNQLANTRLIRCALSDSTGVLTLHAQSDGDTRATIIENSIRDEEDLYKELVPVVTLDSLISVITSAGKDIILKVDVEGAEWMVFQGSFSMIEDYRPVVIFENLPSRKDEIKQNQQRAISEFFGKINYGLYVIEEKRSSIRRINIIDNKEEYLETNYLAVADEQRKLFTMLA